MARRKLVSAIKACWACMRRRVWRQLAISIQAVIGIVTLVTQVPLHAGVTHQGMALVVLAFAVAHLRGFYGERAKPVLVEVRD